MSGAARTLAGELRRRADSDGDGLALRFTDVGGVTERWTWAEAWARSSRIAAGLRERGVGPGDRVLLLAPDVREAVAAHLGAWALGASPVHLGLPFRTEDIEGFVAQLQGTAERLGARALLLSRSIAPFVQPKEFLNFSTPSPGAVPIADLLATRPAAEVDPDTLPPPDLVQLTSGSTRGPRAVVVPHGRLLLHLEAIAAALPPGEGAAGVTWLPLHHDMGLIGGLLHPLHARFPVHLLAPFAFQARPYLWLQALSEDRATHTAAPPSAYALLLRLAGRAAAAGLRLDRLRCAMIGAEPISAGLLRRFASAFAPCGLDPRAFFPVYGLAEATVAVTFPPLLRETVLARLDAGALQAAGVALPASEGEGEGGGVRELVGVGAPLPGTELRIVGAAGEDLQEGHVGEICVRAPSLMSRYDGEPAATAEALAGGWLRTGDLGLLLDGELFVTGRRKELIIKGGHNLYPEPIEAVVSEVEGVRSGCVAAVGLPDAQRETERACVVAETRLPEAEWQALRERIREALRRAGVAVDQVTLVAPGALPRTTSGKLRRGAVAAACGLR